jgi:hypothetical protein
VQLIRICLASGEQQSNTSGYHFFSPEQRSCGATDYRFGQWSRGANGCGMKAQYDHPLTEKCTFRGTQELTSPHHYADWCWKPFGCVTELFSVKEFCRKLGGRGILVVGDSIQHQLYDALFMQLETAGQPLGQWTLEPDIMNTTSGGICVGQGGGRLIYLRNDQIAVTSNTPLFGKNPPNVYRSDWTTVAPMFGIIILNKGAHYIPDNTVFESETRTTAHWLLNNINFNKTQVFFRDTPQGHPHATEATVAVSDPLLSTPNWLKLDQYRWCHFPHRNKEAIDIFESILGPFVTILHVSHMTSNRPDGHRQNVCGGTDNLHYLLPSVVDSWIHPLYNLMREVHR